MQIMQSTRKPVNKRSLRPWYVKLAKFVSSSRWSAYASNCHSTEYFSDNSGLKKETSVRQVGSAQNTQIETLTLDSLSQPQKHFPSSSLIIQAVIIVQPREVFHNDIWIFYKGKQLTVEKLFTKLYITSI